MSMNDKLRVVSEIDDIHSSLIKEDDVTSNEYLPICATREGAGYSCTKGARGSTNCRIKLPCICYWNIGKFRDQEGARSASQSLAKWGCKEKL